MDAAHIRKTIRRLTQRFPCAAVSLRFGTDQEVPAVESIISGQERAALFGNDPNYRGTIYVVVDDMPPTGIPSNKKMEVLRGDMWQEYRITQEESIFGVAWKLTIGSMDRDA